jgi:peptidoglycan/xylan/chitin deacetylase (PgdA/CDA1 family)
MKSFEKICFITNDVETTSILNHKLRDITGGFVLKQGMPRLLDLYARNNIKTTFFFTGHIARLYPDLVRLVQPYGHEIGSHGLSHEVNLAFDVLPLVTQIEHLKISKKILEDISGEEVISFRAPAARVSNNISIALAEAGFFIDSSISSQRLDMFMSFGSIKKLNWLITSRKPYFCHPDNIFKKGNSQILEIPISAMGLPYIGTLMRISPFLSRLTRNLLYLETNLTGRHFNFLTHPNEFIDEDREISAIDRRGSNYFSYLLGDIIRYKLKQKNLGVKAIPIFEKELQFFSRKNFVFKTCKEFYFEKIKVKDN